MRGNGLVIEALTPHRRVSQWPVVFHFLLLLLLLLLLLHLLFLRCLLRLALPLVFFLGSLSGGGQEDYYVTDMFDWLGLWTTILPSFTEGYRVLSSSTEF